MTQIANNEDYDWTAAIMQVDDFDSIVFLNDNNKQKATTEISKISKEIYRLFKVYANQNEMKYFGYKWDGHRNGGTFGLILYDSKDIVTIYR